MGKGCIEIGNINTRASAGVIRKLKSILDQHGIFHIIDDVMFYDSHTSKQIKWKQFTRAGSETLITRKTICTGKKSSNAIL